MFYGALSLFSLAFVGLGPVNAQEAAPGYTIPNSRILTLPVTSNGRHYALYVGLPASYGKDPARRYPVVYVTDGYWDFPKITNMGGGLAYDRVVPEFITIGLGYAGSGLDFGDLRRWELSPAPFGDNGEKSGHAADFLETLRSRIIPLVDAEYHTDPSYRVLAGASLGGLFTLYAMFSRPELFQAYIAATPAVTVSDDWLFRYEERFAQSGATLKGRLYMSVGSNESPAYLNGVIRFNQRLASRRHAGFDYDFRIVEGERHGGAPFESYTRGLRFAFLPRAPETGPAPGP
ncbi:alpha/beta hydrolase [Sphingomonas sp. Root241]|uniref:alpha/beta hydrolase n=1 Tax=Sphingomonas sp. Root241 TaxID=1736501 RepID=UPI000A6A4A56|nr:alpha/beta hydrolase-fold protein [Sphingomonas sp. Root241]